MQRRIFPATQIAIGNMAGIASAQAMLYRSIADREDRVELRLDKPGERINNRLERRFGRHAHCPLRDNQVEPHSPKSIQPGSIRPDPTAIG